MQVDDAALSALAIAATAGNLEVVKVLVRYGAHVHDARALAGATASKHADVVRYLLSYGADPVSPVPCRVLA